MDVSNALKTEKFKFNQMKQKIQPIAIVNQNEAMETERSRSKMWADTISQMSMGNVIYYFNFGYEANIH